MKLLRFMSNAKEWNIFRLFTFRTTIHRTNVTNCIQCMWSYHTAVALSLLSLYTLRTVRKFTITKARALASILFFVFVFVCVSFLLFILLLHVDCFFFFLSSIYIEHFAYVNSWHAYFRKIFEQDECEIQMIFFSLVCYFSLSFSVFLSLPISFSPFLFLSLGLPLVTSHSIGFQ